MAGLADIRVNPVAKAAPAATGVRPIVIPSEIDQYRDPAPADVPQSSLADFLPSFSSSTPEVVTTDVPSGPSLADSIGSAMNGVRDWATGARIDGEAKSGSVLETARPVPVDPLDQTGGAPFNADTVKAVTMQLAGMTPQERLKAGSIPGAYGTLARKVTARIDANAGSPVDRVIGGQSLEERTRFYLNQGAGPETAQNLAAQDIHGGYDARSLDQARPTSGDAQAMADGRAEGLPLQKYGVATRGVIGGVEGLKQGGLGVAAAALRLVGDDKTAEELEKSAFKSKSKTDAMNELTAMRRKAQEAGIVSSGPGIMDATYLEDMATGGVASAAQNIPGMAAGAATAIATKNPMLGGRVAMGLMTTQAFGSSFIDGRQRGYTPGHAASYAGAMAAFEFLGERYGLIPAAMNAFKAKAGQMPLAEIPAFMERFIGKAEEKGLFTKSAGSLIREQLGEQVGEQLTGAGQYLIEGSALGMDKPMSVRDFIGNAVDTSVQTLIATGLLQGGGRAGRAAIDSMKSGTVTKPAKEQATLATSPGLPETKQATTETTTAVPATESPIPATQKTETAPADAAVPAEDVLGSVDPDSPVRQDIEQAAHEAATSPLNDLPEPTQAQKEAGNYKVGRVKLHGLDISIENPRGSERSGTSPDGTEWSNTLAAHYGYVRGTEGNDGDHVDTFIGPNPDSEKVFVVDQVNEDGSFDEHKVLLGADSLQQADDLYHANYHAGWTGRGAITEMPLDQFKQWVKDGPKTEPVGKLPKPQQAPVQSGVSTSDTKQPVAPVQQAQPATKPVAEKPLSIGTTPNSSDPITVKDGVVHIGKYPAQNFETGDDVTVPEGATRAQIKQALKDAGAIGNHQKVFNVDEPQENVNGNQADQTKQAEPQQQEAPAAPVAVHYGRDNVPLSEGGKPFTTRKEAGDARRLQPHMRVVSVKGGHALAEKTAAQLAAEEKAAKRLRNAGASEANAPIPAHAFIADAGGLSKDAMSDAGFDRNVKIRTKWLFGAQGRGMTIEQATERLKEAGYLKQGDGQKEALDLIRKSVTNPQYTPEGWERLAEAEQQTQYADHLAAQQEAAQDDDYDPFVSDGATSFEADDLDVSGHAKASKEIQLEVAALHAQMESLGLDPDAVKYDIATQYPNYTDQEFYEHVKSESQAALEAHSAGRQAEQGGDRNTGKDVRQPSDPGTGQREEGPSQVTKTPSTEGVSTSGPEINRSAFDRGDAVDRAWRASIGDRVGRYGVAVDSDNGRVVLVKGNSTVTFKFDKNDADARSKAVADAKTWARENKEIPAEQAAHQPEPVAEEKPTALIELRKRESVLKALRKCLES